MNKSFKQFVCNSLCRINKKTFYPGNKVYLVNEFKDSMFDYDSVTLATGKWQGVTSKSYFIKHFNFVCKTEEPILSKTLIN